jgi:NAD(P)-dependent dehydrogenase (short-subunit alcohol dehydrogenase family)
MLSYAGLKDKHILIAGAARGIGAAVAWRLAEAGAHISLCDINADTLESTSESIRSRFGEQCKVFTKVVDIAKPEEVDAWVTASVEAFGKIDGCVNNAGMFTSR